MMLKTGARMKPGTPKREVDFMASAWDDLADVTIDDREGSLTALAGASTLSDFIGLGLDLLAEMEGDGDRLLEAAKKLNSTLTISQLRRAVRLARWYETGRMALHSGDGVRTLVEAEMLAGIRDAEGTLREGWA